MSKVLKIHQHLFQIYPSMPKYAADPSQSQIIRIYDHITLRFSGHYGWQPQYFIKSPLCPVLFGDSHRYVSLPTVSFNSSQNIIIAISKTFSKKIRLNHYETTLYGELQLSTSLSEWKFNKTVFEESELSMNISEEKVKNQQHNLVMKVLKVFAQGNGLMELEGLDVLVYKDFKEQEFLYSKEAFIYGLYTAVHACLLRKVPLQDKTLHKAFQKIADASTTHIESLPQLINASYNTLCHFSPSQPQASKQIPFPSGYALIIADTMTPQPQKLIKGKRFNLRECEIQIGIELIMSELGIVKEVRSIKELMDTIQCDVKEMLETVDSSIPNKPMSTQQIETLLQKPLIEVLKHIPFANNVIDENIQFHPHNRLRFFLQQQSLIDALTLADNQVDTLQSLMKVSMANAWSMLQITSQQIEEIQKISSSFGGVCKVLGNGWGGSVAILVKEEMAEKLEKDLIERFYLAQQNKILLGDDVEVYIKIVGKPQVGLAILDPTHQIWFG